MKFYDMKSGQTIEIDGRLAMTVKVTSGKGSRVRVWLSRIGSDAEGEPIRVDNSQPRPDTDRTGNNP